MTIVYVYGEENVYSVVSLLLSADATLPITPLTEDACDGMWFETTADKDQIARACNIALTDMTVAIYYDEKKEKIYTNYVCYECGSKDEDVHHRSCNANAGTIKCYCYDHSDEV